jgi:[pyruvate, water dikinase]-phosphate phosphotransferase / [pyruvate, water dikinase] kinase
MTRQRMVFFVSDRTGITAETLGNTLLTQFDGVEFRKLTLPFVNTPERARQTVDYIDSVAASADEKPLVFSTTVNDDIRSVLRSCHGLFLDLFDSYIPLIEKELGMVSTHTVGRAHGVADPDRYRSRIAAMNYAMEHDDGLSTRDLSRANVILVAPSRCGKTPTCLYLALQHGIFATNFPLTEDDLEHVRLPKSLDGLEARLFGLTSDAERLAQVRSERRPGSKYASLAQCAYELRQAEQLFRKKNIPFVNSANMSVEEIATVVMQEKQLRRQTF